MQYYAYMYVGSNHNQYLITQAIHILVRTTFNLNLGMSNKANSKIIYIILVYKIERKYLQKKYIDLF